MTNGDQTDTIYDFLAQGKTFEQALDTRCFEPDDPNFTPRISADSDLCRRRVHLQNEHSQEMRHASVLPAIAIPSPMRRSAGWGTLSTPTTATGIPFPRLRAEPERVQIPDDMQAFAKTLWENLNADNKISLYVRYTDLATGKFERVLINKNK